ncbi:MAG TPA: hypothetical protein VL294_11465 [Pseudolysinimonas sp.]|jgi:hypothetical protein|nr:hypothetical protein [Pseudolysinimonas sp.]
MTSITLPRTLGAGLFVVAAALGLTGCEVTAPGELGQDQQILATCPADQRVAEFVTLDGSGSNQVDALNQDYLEIVEQLLRRTAICGGRLTVTVFSASSGSTVLVYDGEVEVAGATDIARLRRVPEKVEEVMAIITENYGPAMEAAPEGGTDITGLYRLLGEHAAQLPEYRLEATIVTDGLNNLGVNTERALSHDDAVALADQITVPALPEASITVAGLGRVAEGTLPSNVIEGLVAFYTRLCENTGASQCLAVTDWR